MNDKKNTAQKESLNNSLSKNKYCFCKNYGKRGECLICKSLKSGIDYRKINESAANKYTIAITGTNGKTTLTNVIGIVLSKIFNNKVSYASTTGIYENGIKISNLEHRASEHYVYLLNQPQGEIVISEQPEAGIYKFGLPKDHDIGIITNMAEDHLERYWIRSGMDDLYNIKSLIAKMSSESYITSVDYFWTRKLIEDFNDINIYLYGRDNEQVNKYHKMGYQVVTVRGDKIIILDGDKKIEVGSISDFLLTLHGILDYNIENLLAIISLFYNSEKLKPYTKKLIDILKEITPSFSVNPARFNVLDYKNNIIVFDYAHNLDGFENSLKSLVALNKQTNKGKLIGLVAVAGDRTEKTIDQISKLFLRTFDKVFVRSVAGNDNINLLSRKLATKDGDIWNKGYDEFIKEFSRSDNIIYITIAGHGHVNDLAQTIKKFNIKDIRRDSLFN